MLSTKINLIINWPFQTASDANYELLDRRLKSEYSNQIEVFTHQNQRNAIEDIMKLKDSKRPIVLITKLGTSDETSGEKVINTLREHKKTAFIILHSHTACSNPNTRWYFASKGVNMVTQSIAHVFEALDQIVQLNSVEKDAQFTCPYCDWENLSFGQLQVHVPFYHTNTTTLRATCEFCKRMTNNFAVHLIEEHKPRAAQRDIAAPLYAFSLVVCQRKSDKKFLVVQEAGSMGFWLPGGRVEIGEELQHAAERETLEEAGVQVRLTGILKIEFSPKSSSNRLRIIFFAEPFDENNCEPKTVPNYER